MDEIEFLVQGSSSEPYKVSFVYDNQELNAFCTCAAGLNGQYCKHRIQILEGVDSSVISKNKNDVRKITTWLKGTSLQKALDEFKNANKEYDEAAKLLQLSKKKLANAMKF